MEDLVLEMKNLSKAVELGIAKVNICTDLLNAARDNTKDGYAERSYYDSVTLAKDGFKDCLKHYYEVFHTNNKRNAKTYNSILTNRHFKC